MKRRDIGALDVLNRKAVENAYDFEDLDWSRPVDRSKPWSPEHIAPLFYLPSYAKFTPEEKRRYNQLFSMGVCEQFIWLEEHLLVNTLRKVVQRSDPPAPLKEALGHFIAEELKHTRMFWRMLEKSEPGWYPTRKFRLYNISALQQAVLDLVLKLPNVFLIWIWTAVFFEERTVDYCRHYLEARKRDPEAVDATYTQVHEYHFKDELRHYQLDQHLLAWMYDPQPRWKKRLAARMFRSLMRSYVFPNRTSRRVLEVLAGEFPRLRAEVLPALLKELPDIGRSRAFHRMAFSKDSVPKTMALFAEYPELDGLWNLFLEITKEEASG
ncbi:MAG: P-aminobenzoate N-oxygenase AurF [Fibrobacteres bacterium]|nr:P-aminobenzoate N-oxygenase AurF [Fibrobacterota bacterium]